MIKLFTFFTALFMLTGFIVIMVLMLYCCCIVSSLSDEYAEKLQKQPFKSEKGENKDDHI